MKKALTKKRNILVLITLVLFLIILQDLFVPKDTIAPDIVLNPISTCYLKVGEKYIEAGCAATDNIDGDITSKVEISNNINTQIPGVYTVSYTVADSAGNVSSSSRILHVYQEKANHVPIDPGEKIVYLTFDDGPSRYTEELLDILERYNIKATFFVTNQEPEYQDVIKTIYDQGHTIGLHSATHQYEEIYINELAYYEDLKKINDIVVSQTKETPSIVRFPGGTSNKVSLEYCEGIMTDLSKSIAYHGYLYCDWNVTGQDSIEDITATQVAENVISGIKNQSISVVLLHDTKQHTIEAMEQIITWAFDNGYTFLSMDNTTPFVQHKPVN